MSTAKRVAYNYNLIHFNLKNWLDNKLYPGVQDRWDDKLFREIIVDYLEDDFELLDLGAGSGRVPEMNFQNYVTKVYGIDPDPGVKNNPYLDEGIVGIGEELPFKDDSFDAVVSDNVLEHLDRPREVFKEVFRVLKPGGYFFFKTPNKYHYIPLIARSTPHPFHEWVNKKRGRRADDTFPTRYLANSKQDIERLAREAQFIIEQLELHESRPEYLRFSPPTYFAGWIYERLVNNFSIFKEYRVLLTGTLKKPMVL